MRKISFPEFKTVSLLFRTESKKPKKIPVKVKRDEDDDDDETSDEENDDDEETDDTELLEENTKMVFVYQGF